MHRKTLILSGLTIILSLLFLSACAGPAGEPGPLGPAGAAGPQGPAGPPGEDASVRLDFVGSEKCGQCHEAQYTKFILSGHPYKLTKIENGEAPTFPYDSETGGVTEPPDGYTWDDITYVIGGFGWKARFIDQEGYIITGDADALTQWNYANDRADLDEGWAAYHPGEERPYNCGTCHTTGYRPEGHQDDLEGIIGTWEFPGIQCEECHGPGNLHASDPYGHLMVIDRSPQACGDCHIRGNVAEVDASGGFIRHHEQYEELYNSKHFAIGCIACHDPHASAVYSDEDVNPSAGIMQTCETCHWQQTYQNNDRHFALECVDCHMPPMVLSAQGDLERFTGDLSTHLFSINPDPDAPQFNEDGSLTMPYITLDYACNHCHGIFATVKEVDQLADTAEGYHTMPEPTATPAPEPTPTPEG